QRRARRLLPRPAVAPRSRACRRGGRRAARPVAHGRADAARRRRAPARRGGAGTCTRGVAAERRQGGTDPVRVLITGGRGVLGVRELAARLMPHGGSIVATASLAGLTATPLDPIYSLTKHAVIGFVRSCAPQLATRGIRINALCPGFTDTPIVPDEHRE